MPEHPIKAAVKAWPVKSLAVRRALAQQDICPECGHSLDTGWECISCDFDARPLIRQEPAHD